MRMIPTGPLKCSALISLRGEKTADKVSTMVRTLPTTSWIGLGCSSTVTPRSSHKIPTRGLSSPSGTSGVTANCNVSSPRCTVRSIGSPAGCVLRKMESEARLSKGSPSTAVIRSRGRIPAADAGLSGKTFATIGVVAGRMPIWRSGRRPQPSRSGVTGSTSTVWTVPSRSNLTGISGSSLRTTFQVTLWRMLPIPANFVTG